VELCPYSFCTPPWRAQEQLLPTIQECCLKTAHVQAYRKMHKKSSSKLSIQAVAEQLYFLNSGCLLWYVSDYSELKEPYNDSNRTSVV
jgi:hypothetical protein